MAAPHSYTIDHGKAVPAQGGHTVNNMHRAAAGRPGDGDIGALVTCRGVQRLGGDQGQRPVSGAEDCGLRGNILRIFAQNANKRTFDFFQLLKTSFTIIYYKIFPPAVLRWRGLMILLTTTLLGLA